MLDDPWHFIAETSQHKIFALLKKWKKDHLACAVFCIMTLGEIGCTDDRSYPVLHNAAIAYCSVHYDE